MDLGPMSYLAFEFEGNKMKGEALKDLMALAEKKIIRVLDLVAVMKDAKGKVTTREIVEMDPDEVILINPLKSQIKGLFTTGDLEAIGGAIRPNTTAALLLVEHLWAAKFFADVKAANGRLVENQFIPGILVQEALEAAEAA
ncbi:MAG TPA: DUF6325 family protein [Anaerolineales bacterium]|nr:DUF6325 family protein [Anaerolineales bacterium]